METGRTLPHRGNMKWGSLILGTSVLVFAFAYALIQPIHATTTEELLRDAILGRIPADQQTMDLNKDGVVDAADLVKCSRIVSANFAAASSVVNEKAGTRNVAIVLNRPMDGVLRYVVGGTAKSGEDFSALSGSVPISGTSASIPVSLLVDTAFEGDETIVLKLLPDVAYQLGTQATHTIALKDNPSDTRGDYLFVLSTETPGVTGNLKTGKGFPPTVFSRKANVTISFSKDQILNAWLNIANSTGIPKKKSGSQTIAAHSVSCNSGVLRMVFIYMSQSPSFASDPSLITFDPQNPSLGNETPRPITTKLALTLNGFDIGTDRFTDKYLEGTFSLSMAGILNEATRSFFKGSLAGTMQR